jgi:hypothetical protein
VIVFPASPLIWANPVAERWEHRERGDTGTIYGRGSGDTAGTDAPRRGHRGVHRHLALVRGAS